MRPGSSKQPGLRMEATYPLRHLPRCDAWLGCVFALDMLLVVKLSTARAIRFVLANIKS